MGDKPPFTASPLIRANGTNANGGNGSKNVLGSKPMEVASRAKSIYISPSDTMPERIASEAKITGRKTMPMNGPKPLSIDKQRFKGDLADHFLGCAKLGRYLTVADNSRFIITDDFRTNSVIPAATAVAAIYSKDHLVAQAALLPLSERARTVSLQDHERFERLFSLIEEQALSDDVRSSAQAVRKAQFRTAEINALEAALGERLSPARLRYRQFLETIKKLIDRKITAGPFLDEFRAFTQEVAGKLDFGIYSFCLDRLFGSVRVPLKVKKLLVLELLKYPPLIRRELLTNILVLPGQVTELLNFVRDMVTKELGPGSVIEIELLEAFKSRKLSISDIESSLSGTTGGNREGMPVPT